MFAEVGNGMLVNLALVARIHVVNHGASGTILKFYSPNNELLADYQPATPEDLERVMGVIQSFGRGVPLS
jgi:hypothetical protein